MKTYTFSLYYCCCCACVVGNEEKKIFREQSKNIYMYDISSCSAYRNHVLEVKLENNHRIKPQRSHRNEMKIIKIMERVGMC